MCETDTDSDDSGSKVDVSCSRCVEFQVYLAWMSIEEDLLYGPPLLSRLGPEHLKLRVVVKFDINFQAVSYDYPSTLLLFLFITWSSSHSDYIHVQFYCMQVS